eukprot:2197624-Pyramimonas_sp.AAC.1
MPRRKTLSKQPWMDGREATTRESKTCGTLNYPLGVSDGQGVDVTPKRLLRLRLPGGLRDGPLLHLLLLDPLELAQEERRFPPAAELDPRVAHREAAEAVVHRSLLVRLLDDAAIYRVVAAVRIFSGRLLQDVLALLDVVLVLLLQPSLTERGLRTHVALQRI